MENQRNEFGFLVSLRKWFLSLFRKKLKESFIESGVESRWEAEYKKIDEINFTEIFANRLTNYTIDGCSIHCEDENIDELYEALMAKAQKWVQMAYGTGRVFLIPYIVANRVYTDIIPQGRAWVTNAIGDDVTGIGVLADIRFIGNRRFYRFTSYEYDPTAKTFVIENKATNDNGGEVPLSTFDEWATIEPIITLNNVEKPLFAYVDSPKDNRTTDRLQGAPITLGCEYTIKEIKDALKQYCEEFNLKQSWLGVDRIMLGKDGKPDSHLFKTFDGKSTENMFEIFSPDIRDASYRARLLDLFGRLEKQVGTSNGILTPAETANATATQVRRSMYDTLSMVNRMRASIDNALDALAYTYSVYLGLVGINADADAPVKKVWSDGMLYDSTERFAQMMQARGVAVTEEEIRQFLMPNEGEAERAAAIQSIKENAPEPVIPDFFGG